MGTFLYYLLAAGCCMLAAFLILHKSTSTLKDKDVDEIIKRLQNIKRSRNLKNPQYTYFITYVCDAGMGRCEVDTHFPISSINDIIKMELMLNRKNKDIHLISNFQLIRDASGVYKDNIIMNFRDILLEWYKIVNDQKRRDSTKITLLKNSDAKVASLLKEIEEN